MENKLKNMKGLIKRLLREGLGDVNYLHIDDVDDDNDYEHYLVDAKNMAKDNGIGLGDNELAYIALIGNKLVGVTWIGVAGVFSFDIVVDSAYQSKGIGSRLIDMVMNKYKARVKIAGDNYGIRVNVVNVNLKSYLINKYNLVEDKNESNILVNK